jgi:hypothetical protein
LHRALKRKLVIGLTAVAVAAFAGGAYAATQSSGPDTRQAFLNDVAKRLHVTPQQLTAALNGAAVDQLQAAVTAGRLTQAEANELEQRLKAAGNPPLLPPFGFFGFGSRGLVAPHLLFGPAPFAVGPGELGAAASYLGLNDLQLFRQLTGGKSLAQLAAGKGKSVSGLEQAMTTAMKSRLDRLVAAKMITAAQEKQVLSRFSAQLAQEVNQKGLLFRSAAIPLPRLRFRATPPAPRNLPSAPGDMPGPPPTAPLPYGPAAPPISGSMQSPPAAPSA